APEINSNGITLCADNFGSTAQGRNLQLWRCHGYASDGTPQRWNFSLAQQNRKDGTLFYQIENVGSGLCIGLDPNRVRAGTIAGSRPGCTSSRTARSQEGSARGPRGTPGEAEDGDRRRQGRGSAAHGLYAVCWCPQASTTRDRPSC
ncbi:MAG TPA: hypothetical protein VE979_25665, partial [Streptosporangiaceae bacterium]|nr:hypothetical protein [Streptosporangiaceae bacterium]